MEFERVKNHAVLNGAGPDAQSFDLRIPDTDWKLKLEAWMSNFGSCNVHICRGNLQLSQCQQLLERGLLDILMTVTGNGPSMVWLPDDCDIITVFFEGENVSGLAQVITVRVSDRHE